MSDPQTGGGTDVCVTAISMLTLVAAFLVECRRAQTRRVAVEALQHLELAELRAVGLDRRVEGQPLAGEQAARGHDVQVALSFKVGSASLRDDAVLSGSLWYSNGRPRSRTTG